MLKTCSLPPLSWRPVTQTLSSSAYCCSSPCRYTCYTSLHYKTSFAKTYHCQRNITRDIRLNTLHPKLHSSAVDVLRCSTVQCSTLIAWCTNLDIGSLVPNRALLFCTFFFKTATSASSSTTFLTELNRKPTAKIIKMGFYLTSKTHPTTLMLD